MGLSGIGTWQLLIILVIVVLIFGTKRLKTLGGDLGSAMKSFRKAMQADEGDKGEHDEHKKIGANAEQRDAEFSEQRDKEHHG